jgi:hypothetical protein
MAGGGLANVRVVLSYSLPPLDHVSGFEPTNHSLEHPLALHEVRRSMSSTALDPGRSLLEGIAWREASIVRPVALGIGPETVIIYIEEAFGAVAHWSTSWDGVESQHTSPKLTSRFMTDAGQTLYLFGFVLENASSSTIECGSKDCFA